MIAQNGQNHKEAGKNIKKLAILHKALLNGQASIQTGDFGTLQESTVQESTVTKMTG